MAMMARSLLLIMCLLVAGPARADDISVAGRSVVRVVVIAFEEGEVVDFGHGSGFAVAPNRIVTNAHVVALAAQYPDNVAIGVVPSEGSQSYRARLVAMDPARDLALIELAQGSVTPIPLFTGALDDGMPVAALGYPGNVDLATAQSAEDYINPLPPTRSAGIFSNVRPINGITTLLHTADIARGHSGGPLLDQCGRVLGVNTLITRGEDGDSPFAFAVANRELTIFLREAGQPFRSVVNECISMADQLSRDRDRLNAEERARLGRLSDQEREAALTREQAMIAIEESRETRLGIAVLLLVLSLIAFGGAGILWLKERQNHALPLAGVGTLLLIGAVAVFFTRPSRADATADPAVPTAQSKAPAAGEDRFAGRNICTLVQDRSRVTVTAVQDVTIDWNPNGCVNGRTQYARNGAVWTRILVPAQEQAVSVLEFRPDQGEYVVTRYLLDSQAMERVRALRRGVEVKTCTADPEARTILADQLRDIGAILPRVPNERLVYTCRNQGAEDPEAPAEDS
ncbi:MAG TPA: serine protease [Allosphingosinicella sp.]|nr:serine protease [Allosphingosinicella sp.]